MQIEVVGIFYSHKARMNWEITQTGLVCMGQNRKIGKSVGNNVGVNSLLKDSRGIRKSRKEGSR